MTPTYLPQAIVEAFLDIVPESHFFTVVFQKQNGDVRKMNCRRGVKAHLAGGESTTKDHPNLVTVYETNNDYRSFDKGRVFFLRGDHLTLGTDSGFAAAVAQGEQVPEKPEVESEKIKLVAKFEFPLIYGINRRELERRLMAVFAPEISFGLTSLKVEEVAS